VKIDEVLKHFRNVKRKGLGQWVATCPAHDDKVPSLSISEGKDGKTLLHCHAGCDKAAVLKAAGLKASDLFPYTREEAARIVAVYPYTDETGKLLFEVCRREPKSFFQRRPNGNGGWDYRLGDVRRVLYHLPALFNADRNAVVWIVEGEKDANTLAELSLVAITNCGGVGKWRAEYNTALKDRNVVILPDNDPQGNEHAKQILRSLQGIARSVRILDLPGVPLKGDVSDWLDAGHTRNELLQLVEQTPILKVVPPNGPVKITVKECLEVVNRWLLLPDNVVVRYLLALVVANRLPGDPVWGFIIAPSGGTKTELLNSLNGVPEIYPLSDLTPQTFLSGYTRNKKASLLKKLQPGTILTLKDFTTVLSMHRDSRQAILSQLREIADGSYRKEFGTGESIVWEGKLGFIAGCTPVIDQHQSVYGLLGERFLQIRPPLPKREALAKAARNTAGKETRMRSELREAMASCIAGVKLGKIPRWPEDLGEALDSLATLVALARSGTVRDPYHKELQLTPEPEVPTRLVKQLYKLGQALAMLRGVATVEPEDFVIVRQVATDTIPHTRWQILSYLLGQADEVTSSAVATAVGLPTSTTRRHLDDLVGLTLVDGDKKGSGVATKWRVTVECADLVAKSLTLPQKTPHGGKGEIKEEEGDELYTLPTSVERLLATVPDGDCRPFHGKEKEPAVPF